MHDHLESDRTGSAITLGAGNIEKRFFSHGITSALLVTATAMVFYPAFLRVKNSTYRPHEEEWDESNYAICYYLRDVLDGKQELPAHQLDTGDFRLIDRKVVDALKKMPEQSKFLRGQIAWLGFRQGEVLFSRDKRRYGKTGYPLSKMLRFAMDGITAFSDRPLKLVTVMGFAISFLSFAIIVYAMYSHFVLLRTITGWTSLIISSTFIGGVQLLSIGIIGEYISRMNKNILNRPLYVVESSNLEGEKEG